MLFDQAGLGRGKVGVVEYDIIYGMYSMNVSQHSINLRQYMMNMRVLYESLHTYMALNRKADHEYAI
jgi:hypothetical protein